MTAGACWGGLVDEAPMRLEAGDVLVLPRGDAYFISTAPFALGDPGALRSLFSSAGIPSATVPTVKGTARFPSIKAWMYTDVKGWTLADMIDDAQLARLLDEAEKALRPFLAADGTVAFEAPAHIVTATKS
ncbi:MAG TPA: cupin domain-containing protein [Methylomirabilota bacterium]|nr:cupin domain-containing protein [Methylomirabilota bacterium]